MSALTDADKVLRNDTGKDIVEQMKNANALLSIIASSEGGSINTFADLQRIVRMGLASRVLAIGQQIEVERESTISATVGNSGGSTGITGASVVMTTFIAEIGTVHHGDYEFIYDGGAWHLDNLAVELSDYGVTYTGTPIANDEIVIHISTNRLLFDVIGIDVDTPSDSQFTHSVTLALHDCLAGLQFDAIEGAFAVVSDSGLPAGTYHFKCTAQPWYASDVNKNIQFTTTQAVPKGGVLVLGNSYNASMIGKNIITYSTPASTSQIEAVAMSEGTGGTDLGELNRTKQTSGSLVHTNCIDRALLGNNNWKESALRQWLNSDKVAGSVWSAQNVWDRPASWNTNTAGFLYGLDPDFIKACGKVNKRTALNTVCDGGGYVDTEETFFLLARDEVFGNHENGVTEGATYPYFGANYSDYSSPNDGADSNRIKYRSGSAQYWWLRSPTSSYGSLTRRIYPTGGVYDTYAVISLGVVPACVIV